MCIDTTVQMSQTVFSTNLSTRAVNSAPAVHIGSKNGLVQRILLYFELKKNTLDYNDEMYKDSFHASVLFRLKENAIIILDNALYQSVKVEKCPKINWKKADIIGWLGNKGEVLGK